MFGSILCLLLLEVAIAQGSSERNISAVVSRNELSLALKAVLCADEGNFIHVWVVKNHFMSRSVVLASFGP